MWGDGMSVERNTLCSLPCVSESWQGRDLANNVHIAGSSNQNNTPPYGVSSTPQPPLWLISRVMLIESQKPHLSLLGWDAGGTGRL